jgi:hypothetical protein
VLLKALGSLAQAIPPCAMPVFNIPKNICKGITDVFLRIEDD